MIYYRKVLKITAQDSPNVQLALAQKAAGLAPSGEILIPGVLTYDEYEHRRLTWDIIRQTIGLDAEFYGGAEVKLFPVTWLNLASDYARVALCRQHPAEAIGCDPGEGGANTVWCAINKYGLKEMVSKKTPDTSVICNDTIAFMRKHPTVPCDRVCFDRGGGGKQHADRLRSQGYNVRTVAFGESLIPVPKRGMTQFPERREQYEDRAIYKNRRAEMFDELSQLIDPARGSGYRPAIIVDGTLIAQAVTGQMFAIPKDGPTYSELHRQLALFPKEYDREGRLVIPPKNRNPGEKITAKKTLIEIIGNSPDEADALACACYAMLHKSKPQTASVA